ncbi:MAG: methyl-accepting chemotaxis protein [Aquitalea sp.]|nr:methyl-accepting chemotaxis protein [Aquitalea sp.]
MNFMDDIGNVADIQETSAIVSKTDLCGMITYANDAFVRISGYSREELIGQPHNIVRHPDMPKWAFAGLWATLESGELWRGIVKNRTKDGGFYWVEATVVPIRKAGKTIGYMSVRKLASEQQIKSAESLYQGAAPKKKASLSINKMLSIHSGYMLGSLFVMLLLLVGGFLGIGGIRQGEAQLIYQNRQVLKDVLVLSDLNGKVERMQANLEPKGNVSAPVHFDLSEINAITVQQIEKPQLEEIKKDLISLNALLPVLRANNVVDLGAVAQKNVSEIAGKLRGEILSLRTEMINSANEQVAANLRSNALIENVSIAGIVFGISLVLLFGWYFMRSIVRPLEMAIDNFDKMAEGDLTGDVILSGAGETGHLIRSSATMQMHLKVVLDELMLMSRNIDHHCLALNTALFEISDHLDCQHDKLIDAKALFEINTTADVKDQLEKLSADVRQFLLSSEVASGSQEMICNEIEEVLCIEQLRSHTFNDFLEKIAQLSDLVVDNRMETLEAYSMSAQLHTISTQLNEMVSYFDVGPSARNG